MLNGNAGPDFLAGQVGNDTLNGGIGVDTCYQGTGSGAVVRCERPTAPAPVPVPPPAPAPTPTPEPPTLVVAYSDLVRDHVYGAGDILIAKIVDTNGDGLPSKGDTIIMDQHPTKYDASGFAPWGVKSHPVGTVDDLVAIRVTVTSDSGTHTWINNGINEAYVESGSYFSGLQDGGADALPDFIDMDSRSASHPVTTNPPDINNGVDNRFLDVDFLWGGSIL